MVYNNARTRILHVKFCPFISAAKIHCLENVVRFAFHAIMILVFKIFCVTVIVIVKNVFYNQTSPNIYLFDIFFSLFEIQLFYSAERGHWCHSKKENTYFVQTATQAMIIFMPSHSTPLPSPPLFLPLPQPIPTPPHPPYNIIIYCTKQAERLNIIVTPYSRDGLFKR